jgi:ABC-type Mn2+/Zn2+ transport system permease subunit
VAVSFAIGLTLGSWHFHSWSHILKGAPWMLAWATAQQYGLLCFFYRRFLEISADPRAATAGAAVTFAAFHIPNGFLVAVTLLAGVAACTLYRRETNLFAIGMAHALVSFTLLCSLPFSVTHGLRVGPAYLALS